MKTGKQAVIENMEEIIGRLEEVRNDAIEIRESHEMGIHGSDFANEESDESELLEAALFEAGICIDKMTQAILEEIENLKVLTESIEEL